MADFPTSLDDFGTVNGNDPQSAVHVAHHQDAYDAIEAVEAKVGTSASTPTRTRVLRGTGTGTSAWQKATIIDLRDWSDYDPTGAQDSSSAIQAAIDQAAGEYGAEVRGHGVALITSTLVVSTSGIDLVFPASSVGMSSNQRGDPSIGYYDSVLTAFAGEPRRPGLLWGGSAGGTMVSFFPATGVGITGSGFQGGLYAGASPFSSVAGIGLKLVGTSFGIFDVHALEFSADAVLLSAGPMSDARYYERSVRGNIFRRLTARQWVNAGNALRFEGNGLTSTVSVTGISAASPTVVTTSAAHGMRDGLRCQFTGSNSTPAIDDVNYYIKYVSDTSFSLYTDSGLTTPVTVTGAGTTGTGTCTFNVKTDPYRNRFEVVDILHKDGDGVVLGWCDHNEFDTARMTRYSGGTGAGVRFQAVEESGTRPSDNLFWSLAPGAGGVVVEGTADGTYPPRRLDNNMIWHYDPDVDAPAAPTIGTGAGLYWWDRNTHHELTSGATVPTNPQVGDKHYDTDVNQEFYWTGAIWQSTQLFNVSVPSMADNPVSANAMTNRMVLPFALSRNVLVNRLVLSVFIASGATALDASNKWVFNLQVRAAGDSATTGSTGVVIATITIDSGASGTVRVEESAGNTATAFSTDATLEVLAFKTGTPGDLTILGASINFRTITE